MKTLTVLCFDTYSKMLQALNQLLEPALVVEVGTTHRSYSVLLYAGEVSRAVKDTALDVCTLSPLHSEILPAYFKQRSTRAKSNVVCVESNNLSTLFSTTFHFAITSSERVCPIKA